MVSGFGLFESFDQTDTYSRLSQGKMSEVDLRLVEKLLYGKNAAMVFILTTGTNITNTIHMENRVSMRLKSRLEQYRSI